MSNTQVLRPLTHKCRMVDQPKRADLMWTQSDFLALCEHMLNGNELHHFLIGWRHASTGKVRFAKARHKRADKRANWAWNTITGRGKSKTTIGFYPSNSQQMSTWAAIDFDAHDGNWERARRLSKATFDLLSNHPNIYLVLCTSGGGGFHPFILCAMCSQLGSGFFC